MLQLDSINLEDIQRINKEWDHVIQDLLETIENLRNTMKEKQKEEREKALQKFNDEINIIPPSKGDLIYLYKTKKFLLTKQNSPEEVNYVENQIHKTELAIKNDYEEQYKRKLQKYLTTLNEKQLNELQSLELRLNEGIKDKEKERIKHTEKCFK